MHLKKEWTRGPLDDKYMQKEVASPGDDLMSGAASREVLRHLNTLFHCGAAGPLSDEELLERLVAGDHEAAEAAFAALVKWIGGVSIVRSRPKHQRRSCIFARPCGS